MKRVFVPSVAVIVAMGLMVVGCAQPGPSASPTNATAPAEKAAEPTKVSAAPAKAAEPTKAVQAPGKKVDFPAKGRAITWIIPWPAGGSNDVGSRLIAPFLEKELGVPVEIVNKGGAGTQVGLTEIVRAKPDGHTIGQATLPTNISVYLDPKRQAVFKGSDLQPVANCTLVPQAVSVKADSSYKTLKDLVEAARANPEKVKIGDPGLLTASHLAAVLLGRAANVKFAHVHFDGGAPALNAMLGGHVDAQTSSLPVVLSQLKSGQARILGIEEKERHSLYPDIPTMAEQGYKAYISSYYGILVPSGVQNEVLDVLSRATKKSLENPDLKKKLEDMGQPPHYLDTAQFSAEWKTQEELVRSILEEEDKKK